MIEARGLTKRYGRITAVDQLSFDVRPGAVTGFLGPNGSGAANRRAGQLSLGMAQRLGIAAALLGDPPVLIFDDA